MLLSLPYDAFSYNTYQDPETYVGAPACSSSCKRTSQLSTGAPAARTAARRQQSCFFVEFDSRDPEATSAETLLIWSKQVRVRPERRACVFCPLVARLTLKLVLFTTPLQAQLIDAVVTKYSEEAHKFTQLESKRRSSKGVCAPVTVHLCATCHTPSHVFFSKTGYEVKSTRRPRGRFSRSKNDAADAADAAEGGGFLSRMKTLRSSASPLFLRWRDSNPYIPLFPANLRANRIAPCFPSRPCRQAWEQNGHVSTVVKAREPGARR